VTKDNEQVRAYTATFDNLAQQLTEEDRKRQMKGFENTDKDAKAPPYVRPVQVCTDMIEGDWHSAQHVLLSEVSNEQCRHEGKVWTGRTIFGGRFLNDDDNDDDSSDEEGKKPRSRKVHLSSQDDDDDEEKNWVKDVVVVATTAHKDTRVESQSLNQTKQHDDTVEEEKTLTNEEENMGSTTKQVLKQLYTVD